MLVDGRKLIRTDAHAACTVETTIFICNGYDAQIDFGPITAERLVRGHQQRELEVHSTPNSSDPAAVTRTAVTRQQ